MYSTSAGTVTNSANFQEMVWLFILLLVAFTLPFARSFISFILDKLYQFFIQQNAAI